MKKFLLPLLCCLAIPAYGKTAPVKEIPFMPAVELAKHQTTIGRVEEYLSGLTTIVSEFTQTAPDGSLVTGKFYLQRPGKMRWQYNPPTPVLMVSNGSELVYYDYELEQISHIPLDSTLIGFLAQSKIRFEDTVGIRKIADKNGVIRITVAQVDKPTEGELTLEFSDNPLTLRNMIVRDATNQLTTVSLNNAQYGKELDKELFVFMDPREKKR